jgi:hypothetical protein
MIPKDRTNLCVLIAKRKQKFLTDLAHYCPNPLRSHTVVSTLDTVANKTFRQSARCAACHTLAKKFEGIEDEDDQFFNPS